MFKQISALLASFFLLITGLSASTIPQYVITGMNDASVGFSNGSGFAIKPPYLLLFSEWDMGDQVTIKNNDKFFVAPEIVPQVGGFVNSLPIFVLHNVAKNTEIVAWLIALPNMSSLKITAVDQEAGEVTLSDSTTWTVAPEYRGRLFFWEVNDLVMIGANSSLYACELDAIVFNASKQLYTCAVQN